MIKTILNDYKGPTWAFIFLREKYLLYYEKDNMAEVKQETKYNKRLWIDIGPARKLKTLR